MKKRSMLALASLATGFVVAAVTPSHAVDTEALHKLDPKDTLSSLDHGLAADGVARADDALGQHG